MAKQHGTPVDYFTDGEPPVSTATAGTAQQPVPHGEPPATSATADTAQQPVRLFNPVPTPGAATGTNAYEVPGLPRRS